MQILCNSSSSSRELVGRELRLKKVRRFQSRLEFSLDEQLFSQYVSLIMPPCVAIVKAKLTNLRSKLTDVERDNWMYEKPRYTHQ